jgi:hypothetical protein
MVGVEHAEEMKNSYKILVGKPEWKKPLGRPKRRWEDNIRIDHKEIGWDIVALVNTVTKLRVP